MSKIEVASHNFAESRAMSRNLEKSEEKSAYFGIRHLQCVLLFLSLAVGYGMRANFFAAIVAMTDSKGNPNFEEYDWSEQTKSYLLSSFFWGYCITQIPGGQLAVRYGAKIVLLIGIIISTVLAFLTPLAVRLENLPILCALRMLQGLSQGVVFPCTHAILSNWAPIEERGALCSFCYAGTLFGVVIMFAMSGIVAASPLGWPGIFYISGFLGCGWIVVWIIWGANSPEEYAGISTAEKLLIETSLNYENCQEPKQCSRSRSAKIPWLKIFTSPPVLVLIIVHCAHNYGFVMLLIELPTYMSQILATDIKSNALLSALPYFAMLLLSFVFSGVSNVLAQRHLVSISTNRKLLNTIGQWIPAVTLLALAYFIRDTSHINMAIVLLVLTVGVNAASFSGFQVNHIDLSPNFAGVLMGITHCAANIMSVIAPLIVGLIVTDEKNPEQWRIVFSIAAGIYFFGNLLFILFGKIEVQSWNDLRSQKDTEAAEIEDLNKVALT